MTFWMMVRASPGCSSSHSRHLVAHQAFERLADFGADQLVLGLRAELGIGQLDRDDRGQALAHVVAGEGDLLLLQHARFFGIGIDGPGERGAEGGHVGAAVALRDVVGERQDVLVIGIIPFESDVDADPVADRGNGDRLGEQRRLGAVEILHERGDSALVIELMLHPLLVAGVGEKHADAGVEEGKLAVAVLEPFEIVFGDFERVGAGQEGDPCALLAVGRRADDLQRRFGFAVAEAHEMLLAVTPDGQVEPFAERVDDADSDAVETARDLVGVVVAGVLELPAGVELGHDDLGRRNAFLGVDSGRDAAAIVLDRDRAVGVQLNENAVAVPGERLVDRVVRDLEHHVVKARAVIGVADVHAGPFAHRVEALEDLDLVGAIFVLVGVGCHSPDIGIFGRKSRAHACTRTRESGRESSRSSWSYARVRVSCVRLEKAGSQPWRLASERPVGQRFVDAMAALGGKTDISATVVIEAKD